MMLNGVWGRPAAKARKRGTIEGDESGPMRPLVARLEAWDLCSRRGGPADHTKGLTRGTTAVPVYLVCTVCPGLVLGLRRLISDDVGVVVVRSCYNSLDRCDGGAARDVLVLR